MDQSVQGTDAVTDLLALMRVTFGDKYVSYYDGDPVVIPKDSLPAIVVEKVAVAIKLSATGTDEFRSQIRIKLLRLKSDDYNASDTVDLTDKKLRLDIEAIDPATGRYREKTVLYALRTHVRLNNHTIEQQVDIRYDLQPRANMMTTSEGRVEIIVKERKLRPEQATG